MIPGAGRFAGTVMHSARWDSSHGFDGQRVAVIGTGASAVQIVPSIQPTVDHLSVFQRTPGWVLPHPVRQVHHWERSLFRIFPPAQRLVRALVYWQRELVLVSAFTKYDGLRSALERQVRRHLATQVPDPELRAKLTPDYQLGCKRALPSNDFYPALSQPNVDLVTEPIARIEPDGILTTDGELHRVDAIVFATGFHVSDNPIGEHVVGREGHRLSEAFSGDLAELPRHDVPPLPELLHADRAQHRDRSHLADLHDRVPAQLHRSTPWTPSGTAPTRWPRCCRASPRRSPRTSERKMRKTVWASGCASWYQNEHGRNVAMWPDYTVVYRRQTRHFDPADYVIGHRRTSATAASVP